MLGARTVSEPADAGVSMANACETSSQRKTSLRIGGDAPQGRGREWESLKRVCVNECGEAGETSGKCVWRQE